MKVIATELPDVLIVEPDVFGDQRGFFLETYNASRYRDAGITETFVQDNLSYSRRGILRGLHFQNPMQQGKLVQVLEGAVWDVAVDIRRGSPHFGRWVAAELSADNKRQLYIPSGFAHGFLVLSDTALFSYKCTDFYNPTGEYTLIWNDPDLGITWPESAPILSEKDQNGLRLTDMREQDLPVYG